MVTSPNRDRKSPPSRVIWPADTELVGLVFELTPRTASYLYAQYAIGLHAWFWGQVQQTEPGLSKLLQDEQSEKPLLFREWKVICSPVAKNLSFWAIEFIAGT